MSGEHQLYLVRHAIAAERGEAWPDDAKRPLTSKGISRMRSIVDGLRELDVTLDTILSSPLERAKQTAQLLAAGLKRPPVITLLPALAPGTSPAEMAKTLSTFRKRHRIALVGHEPGLGELAAWLIGARMPLPFKKGSVCRIDVAALPPTGTGQLVWFATPRMLRTLVIED